MLSFFNQASNSLGDLCHSLKKSLHMVLNFTVEHPYYTAFVLAANMLPYVNAIIVTCGKLTVACGGGNSVNPWCPDGSTIFAIDNDHAAQYSAKESNLCNILCQFFVADKLPDGVNATLVPPGEPIEMLPPFAQK
jgi:hypothetical protein